MQIVALDVRGCKVPERFASVTSLASGSTGNMQCLVYTLRTDDGRSASCFGFGGKSVRGAGILAADVLRPFLAGRNVHEREALWHDRRKADRWWDLLPVYSWGPVDCCLWLLSAQAAGLPLYRHLGAARRDIPVYASSLLLPDAAAYAAEALDVKRAGLRGYKLHPPCRSVEEDIDIHKAVRQAVGDDFALMSDPVEPSYGFEGALRLGRALEELGYLWLEEPVPDEAVGALAELTRILDIPVIGGEILAKHPYSLADYAARRVVDGLRADVSWSGGITGALKTAHLAEAFHMPCEFHTTIFHPLEIVNLHLCGAVRGCGWLEILWPIQQFSFGLKGDLPIRDGIATMPELPGMGMDLDWDAIDDATFEVF